MTTSRIPVFLITGFLGSGKTRLMRQLARHFAGTGASFLVSEFGVGGIDREVIGPAVVGGLVSGCICCKGYEEAILELDRLSRGKNSGKLPIEIFIETSGASDLWGILCELRSDLRFLRSFDLQCVLTLVDCATGVDSRLSIPEWESQLRYADLVALTHIDEIRPQEVSERIERTRSVVQTLAGDGVTILVAPDMAEVLQAMRSTRHREKKNLDEAIQTEQLDRGGTHNALSLRHGELRYTSIPVSGRHDLNSLLGLARALTCFNPSMMRLKMLVAAEEGNDCYLVQVVSGRLQPPERIAQRGSRAAQGTVYAIDSLAGPDQIRPLVELFLPDVVPVK